jgi:hypothetical protein
MGQFTQNGVIYEELPGGKVRVVGYANPAQSPLTDPRLAPQVQKAQNEATASQYAPQTAQADAQIKAAEAANALDVARANRDKAIAEAKTAELNSRGGPKIDAATRAKALEGYRFAEQLQQNVDELRQLYTVGPGSTQGIRGLQDYLPYTANKNFDTKANASRGIVGQTLGFTGGQLNTEREAEKAVGPYLPQSNDRDATIEQKIQTLQELADNGRAKAIQILGGVPDANGNVTPVPPQQAPQDQGPEPDLQLNGGAKTRAQIDPMLKAVGQKVGRMLVSGVPDAQIKNYLAQSGIDPAGTSIDQALKTRAMPEFKRWMRAHPGQGYPLGPEFYTRQVPVSDARRLFNATAATDTGGDVAAGIVAAGNSMLGDRGASLIGSINGDPQMAQTGMALLRAQHPGSSFVGDVAGQALLEAGLGRIPGAQSLLATKLGRPGADALYGAYYGSGDSSNGDPLTGGVTGALTNMGGGMFGRSLQRGAGRIATGVKNQSLQYLDNLGVPLTIGQIGRGSDNILGKAVGGVEERLAGLPGFDAVIGAARQRGERGFNQAAFREAGGSGATGAAGLTELNGLKNNAYSFLDGTDLPIDAQFAGRNAGVRASIPAMPGFGDEVGKSLDIVDNLSGNGSLSGRDWRDVLSDIRGDRSSIVGKPFATQAVRGMKDVENNLLDLADRQGPAGTLDNLNAANRLNAQVQTIASALDKGPVQKSGQMFSAGNLDDASRVNSRKFGGRMASLTGANRPFYDLTQAGIDVMPNLTKDSGTAGRLALIPALSAIGGGLGVAAGGDDRVNSGEMGAGYGALLGLAAMGPYSKTGQQIIQKALLADRPDILIKIGDAMMANPKYAGMFGAGGARSYFLNPPLAQ